MNFMPFILTIVQNPLIGRAKKSLANTTFTTWKGLNVLKSKPISVEDPQTDGQITQRLRMTGIVAFYRMISSAVQLGFKERAIGKSEYNAFVSANIIAGTSVSLPSTVTLVYSAISVALGTIYQTVMTSVTPSAAGDTVTFVWDGAELLPGQSATDKFNAVIKGSNNSLVVLSLEGAARTAGTEVVTVTGLDATDVLECYTFFTKADGSKSSDSTYNQVTA